MPRKVALITGITGQDGSYLTEFLLAKDYEVHGVIRRSSSFNTSRIDHLISNVNIYNNQLFLHYGDMTDGSRLVTLIKKIKPSEIYNLAAQSHVRVSFDEPEYTGDSVGLGVTRLLEAVRISDVDTKFYQASSSEMFGAAPPPQNEETLFYPKSPYGAAKAYAYWMTKNYREAYGMFACNGILFNHESERRGGTFVTKKIAMAAARIAHGIQKELYLGNLEAVRDWGYAPEYVEGMWRMLQLERPQDFVLGTGKGYSVKDFAQFCFSGVGLDFQEYVKFDPKYSRPSEVDILIADSTKARIAIDWSPKVVGPQLADIMVNHEVSKLENKGSNF